VSVRLDHLVQPNNIRVVQLSQNLDLTVDLLQAIRAAAKCFSSYELDSNFDCAVPFPAHLDLAKFTLAERLAEDVVAELATLGGVFGLGVILSAPSSSTAAIVDALTAYETQSSNWC
jgi:hypothetical protein